VRELELLEAQQLSRPRHARDAVTEEKEGCCRPRSARPTRPRRIDAALRMDVISSGLILQVPWAPPSALPARDMLAKGFKSVRIDASRIELPRQGDDAPTSRGRPSRGTFRPVCSEDPYPRSSARCLVGSTTSNWTGRSLSLAPQGMYSRADPVDDGIGDFLDAAARGSSDGVREAPERPCAARDLLSVEIDRRARGGRQKVDRLRRPRSVGELPDCSCTVVALVALLATWNSCARRRPGRGGPHLYERSPAGQRLEVESRRRPRRLRVVVGVERLPRDLRGHPVMSRPGAGIRRRAAGLAIDVAGVVFEHLSRETRPAPRASCSRTLAGLRARATISRLLRASAAARGTRSRSAASNFRRSAASIDYLDRALAPVERPRDARERSTSSAHHPPPRCRRRQSQIITPTQAPVRERKFPLSARGDHATGRTRIGRRWNAEKTTPRSGRSRRATASR